MGITKISRLLFLASLLVMYCNFMSAQIISTFAGGFGTGIATNAELNSPLAIATDHAGNIYFSEGGHNIVRKINLASGTATIVAGSGCNNYEGDGGPAIGAALYLPSGLAVDRSGNLYIADNENHAVRKVNT